MHKRFPSFSGYGLASSPNRRILLVALVVTVLIAAAGVAAWITGRSEQQHAAPSNPPAASTAPSGEAVPKPPAKTGPGTVPAPARIAEPVAYARAVAAMLWSYDTRSTSRDQQLAGMNAWMSRDTQYVDWNSVTAQVPDPVLWSRMADQAQYATAKVTEGHYPSAFKQALTDDPSKITEAYIYAVTVTGKQQISWKNGGGGTEERSVTLAVQCRPSHDCTLVAIAPRVAP